MSWTPDGVDTSNRVPFAAFKCKVCGRKCITTGSLPSTPCVCSPAPRHGAANKGRVRR